MGFFLSDFPARKYGALVGAEEAKLFAESR
jgi:hypothetical protein